MMEKSIWSKSRMNTEMEILIIKWHGKPDVLRNFSQCHYVNTCHLDCVGIEIGAPATRN